MQIQKQARVSIVGTDHTVYVVDNTKAGANKIDLKSQVGQNVHAIAEISFRGNTTGNITTIASRLPVFGRL